MHEEEDAERRLEVVVQNPILVPNDNEHVPKDHEYA